MSSKEYGREYRVRWQREGLSKRIRIYQTLDGAKNFVKTLKGDYYSSEYEEDYYSRFPKLISDPVIESRQVAFWS